jgi:cbb3-type cytochrome oxidase maturation protein
MSVVYVLVPLALIIVTIALVAFIRSVRGGQFDDLDTPAHRMLIDDESTPAGPEVGTGADHGSPGDQS